ncbi:DUF5995 family protein [Blastococcus sp. SYSU D00922]
MTTATPHLRSVEDVLAAFREVVDDAARTGDRVGYFAALYRQVTLAVARGIERGDFDDGERMDRLDATFAGRYLDALRGWRAGAEISRSWRAAFRAADEPGPVLVQHLVLGVNAHINLDLAVAAARTCPGAGIVELEGDFHRVNDILVATLADVQEAVADLSPMFGVLDVVLGRLDEAVIGFDIVRARSQAWEAAELLARQPPDAAAATERLLDRYATGLARVALAPPFPMPAALELLRATERTPVGDAVRRLDRG